MVSSPAPRRMLVTIFFLMALVRESGRHWQIEDWRSVPNIVNESDSTKPYVLVYSGLIENKKIEWLTDTSKIPFLLSPFSYYTLQAEMQPLPPEFKSRAAVDFFASPIRERITQSDSFYLVCLEQYVVTADSRKPICQQHVALLSDQGFDAREIGGPGLVHVYLFTKNRQ